LVPTSTACLVPPQGEVCERLLRLALGATVVSRRLFMFHAAFMHLVARPPGATIEQVGALHRPARLPARPG
jgi:hypothetical protein